jgi:hypothetical protein
MISLNKILPIVVAGIAVAPLTIYALTLAWDFTLKAWKVGWNGSPLTFIGMTGISAFVIYGLVIAIFGFTYAHLNSDRGVWLISLFTVVVLALYGIAFASSFFGLLPNR